ncbi:MFS transporter [Cellulomonas shaoxiangyii]|uniref:MFS transporter n=1 Tax=Cellulomonas shaoxiangyii TaxID=2566013 RepID=A0A4P7SJC9_9CELL|nr:MFS transporter [Cellulomonas shaoxiangyii]QCB93921.1 MFS transporter [Cellulomonas shaoxiangyii]TGY85994.1 MFS transporter [Cellulomonas shaoxiangyii]
MSEPPAHAEDLWRARRTTTVSLVSLVVLVAFESFAVTTVMPGVADALDGHALYAFAFAGPLATGVVGMVVAGAWSDRAGPFRPFVAGAALFVAGLVVAGAAASMPVLVAGRLAQGLGGGAVNVTVIVTLARAYPAVLHPRAFAWISAAWVLPSLVGPTVAGLIAQAAGWRWVFLAVALLVVPTGLPVVRTLRPLGPPERAAGAPSAGRRRIVFAALVAAAVLALNLAVELPAAPAAALATAAGAAALLAVRPLLPAGTLRARRGLPSVITTRALVSGAFLGSQAYVPYLLVSRDGWGPAASGLALTTASLAWSGTSAVQGRLGARLASRDAVRIGTGLVAVGVLGALLTAWAGLPPAVLVAAWTSCGAGMGLASSRINVLLLAYSEPGTQGTNSSALSISDAVGAAVALAASGVLFALVSGTSGTHGPGASADAAAVGTAGFAVAFGFTAALAVGAVLLAPRVGTPPGEGTGDAGGDRQPGAGSAEATAAST